MMNGDFYNYGTGYPYGENFYHQNEMYKKSIRKHSTRIGVCVLLFLLAPYCLGLGLGITGLYEEYSENLSLQYCVEMFLMVFFLFLPFFTIYLFFDKKDKNLVSLSLEKPASPLLFWLSIPFGLMLCFAGDYVSSVIATFFESIGITLTSVHEYEIPTSGSALFLFAFSPRSAGRQYSDLDPCGTGRDRLEFDAGVPCGGGSGCRIRISQHLSFALCGE